MSEALVNKYFPKWDADKKERILRLASLYKEWNEKINVISRKDIDNVFENHILHSLAIAKVLNFAADTKIMDVGTGGGLPGIPLAIAFPESDFLLVDSIGKKIKVVNEIATALELKNVKGIHSRVEDIKGQFDFITGRGVTDLKVFFGWVQKKISAHQKNALPNGVLYLKGGDLSEEKKHFGSRMDIHHIPSFFDEPFFETKSVVYLSL